MSQTFKYSDPCAWVEVDIKAIRRNFREIRALARRQLDRRVNPRVELLTVVKADAYGHGMLEAARAIEKEGGRFFAVSNLEEAVTLRLSGNSHRILLFETTLPGLAAKIIQHDLTPAVCTLAFARELDRAARKARKKVAVHIKIDTGMGRLGVWHEEASAFIKAIAKLPNLRLEGLMTHFPVADTDRAFTGQQMSWLRDVVADLARVGISFTYLHAANSMGLGAYRNQMFNLARPGLSLYGLYPDKALRKKVRLYSAMSVKSRVLLVKTIHSGQGVSYGHTFQAKKDMPAAVIAVGYSDGYLRAVSNRAHVLINGVACPVRGRVTMDQTVVDISRAGRVRVGDEVVVLGRQGQREITADDLARWAGTINYEIVCNLGNRLPRIYKK
jgi:alanine racemase